MDEVFPVLAGLALGLLFSTRARSIGNMLVLAVLVICAAVTASFISGELSLSWWYVGIDLLEVGLAAAVAFALVPMLRRWRVPRSR